MPYVERQKHQKEILELIGPEPIEKEMLTEEKLKELTQKASEGKTTARESVALNMMRLGLQEMDARGMAMGQWIR